MSAIPLRVDGSPFREKDGEEKEEKKAEEMEMHTLGVEVGGMQLEEEIEEEPVETCFKGFTCVFAADLQELEKSDEWRDFRDHMAGRQWRLCRLVDARPVQEKWREPLGPGSVKVRRVDRAAREVGGARKPCPTHAVRACPAEAGSGTPLRSSLARAAPTPSLGRGQAASQGRCSGAETD
eukprot:CAMPEP_0183485396 /NCGR_PEP_ID=MMETSP0370-20130417/179406_1 /TAXON_ID=268820 /ORGANISM="Peridinium aciculiferum, Strain PAER-2" /LENGTH=179 /DNA_ID=CAMNT_0025678699 /DNA_START=44 /DNA_END=583 /DNA_ORIENTATION=+